MKCEECKYVFYDEATGIFACHRYAPRAIVELPRDDCPMVSDFSRALWPIIHPDDWCGEFTGANPKYPTWNEMEWSIRASKLLGKVGIHSVESLCMKTPTQILGITHLGKTTYREIVRKLAEYNLGLARE